MVQVETRVRAVLRGLSKAQSVIASAAFAAAQSWRFGDLPWLLEFAAGAVLSWLVQAVLLQRGQTAVHVFVQLRRRTVSLAVIAAILLGAAWAAVAAGIVHASLADLLTPVVAVYGVMGVIAGHSTRRLAGQAASPSLVETAARRPRALLLFLFSLVLVIMPSYGSLELVAFLLCFCGGVLIHYGYRELDYLAAERLRQEYELAAVPEPITVDEIMAFMKLKRRRFAAAAKLIGGRSSPASLMILATTQRALGDSRRALATLHRMPDGIDRKQRARVLVYEALLLHDIGKSEEMVKALHTALELDPTCQLAKLGLEILPEHPGKGGADAGNALLRALEAVHGARMPLYSVNERVLGIAWNVSGAMFRVSLGHVLYRMGHFNYAEEVIARAVQLAPRCPLARLHQGLIFAARIGTVRTGEEQREYIDVARIAFTLAIELAPDESVTAVRAREQLQRLERLGQNRSVPPSAPPPPLPVATVCNDQVGAPVAVRHRARIEL